MSDFDYFNHLKSKLEQSNKTSFIVKLVLYLAIAIIIVKMLNIVL